MPVGSRAKAATKSFLKLGLKFVAYYGYDEENVDIGEGQKCGLCGGDEFKRDNFKKATIRLLAQVTARR
jgi:hypothetical protein